MFRVVLVAMLLSPCPGCCLDRVSALTQAGEAAPPSAAVECDCREHSETPGLPALPQDKPRCPCDEPVLHTLSDNAHATQESPSALPEFVIVPRSSLPEGVYVRGHTQLGYATESPRSSPMRR